MTIHVFQNVPNLADNSKPLGPVGNLTILSDIDSEQLNNVMGSYYTKFPMSQQTEYRVGHPHVEERQGKEASTDRFQTGTFTCGGQTSYVVSSN